VSERNWRYLSYLRKHLIAAKAAGQNGAAPTPARTESTTAAFELASESGEPVSREPRYTLDEAFDYFNIPDDTHHEPNTYPLNHERCIRAVAFLLHYCSAHGNENVSGFVAHGLGHVLEECASNIAG